MGHDRASQSATSAAVALASGWSLDSLTVYDLQDLDAPHKVVLPSNFIQGGGESGKLTKKLMINKILSNSLSRDVSQAWLLVTESSGCKLVPFEDYGFYGGKYVFRDGAIVAVSCDGAPLPLNTAARLKQQPVESSRSLKHRSLEETIESHQDPSLEQSERIVRRSVRRERRESLDSSSPLKKQQSPQQVTETEIFEAKSTVLNRQLSAPVTDRPKKPLVKRISVACDGRDFSELPLSPLPHDFPLPSSKMHPGMALRAGASPTGHIACL